MKGVQVKTKKYKGAHILILNDWQNFRYIIFYKGLFFSTDLEVTKRGEYTNEEYILAVDATYQAACATIDQIILQRSWTQKIKYIYKKINEKFTKPTSISEES